LRRRYPDRILGAIVSEMTPEQLAGNVDTHVLSQSMLRMLVVWYI
jgi:hypothetical protein